MLRSGNWTTIGDAANLKCEIWTAYRVSIIYSGIGMLSARHIKLMENREVWN